MSDGINFLHVGIIVIYMGILAAIGWLSKSKVKSCADWYVGNFKIGGIIMGVAFFATYFSAVIMIGFAGSAAKWGLSATVIGLWHPVATLIAFAVLAPGLARMFKELRAMTFAEFLSLRFKSRTVGSASALITAIFIIPYTVGAFIAMGSALSMLTGIPFGIGVVFSGLIIAIYVLSGGLFSASLAEFLQGIVMTVTVVAVLIASYWMLGGIVPAHEALASMGESAVTFPAFGTGLWTTMIGLTAVMGFGMISQPQVILRYATISNRINLKKAMVIAVIGTTIFPFAAYTYGALARPILANFGVNVLTMKDDIIIPTFVNLALPPWLAVLFLVGMLCAATSTIDALVHMTAGTVTHDLLRPVFHNNLTDRRQLKLTKVLALVVSVGCCLLAISPPALIVQLTSYTWTVLGSSFMGPLIAAVFQRKSNKIGAISGMIAGFAVAQMWYLFNQNYLAAIGLPAQSFQIHPFFPGVIVSVAVTLLVSRLTRPMDAEFVGRLFAKS